MPVRSALSSSSTGRPSSSGPLPGFRISGPISTFGGAKGQRARKGWGLTISSQRPRAMRSAWAASGVSEMPSSAQALLFSHFPYARASISERKRPSDSSKAVAGVGGSLGRAHYGGVRRLLSLGLYPFRPPHECRSLGRLALFARPLLRLPGCCLVVQRKGIAVLDLEKEAFRRLLPAGEGLRRSRFPENELCQLAPRRVAPFRPLRRAPRRD